MTKLLEGVTVEYTQTIPTNKQMAEFYVYQEGAESYAQITYLDRVVDIERNGEMRFHIPETFEEGLVYKDKIIRYSDDLEANNPWWEVFAHNEDMGEIYDTFYEAVDAGIDYILDDRNWD